jgi:hydrogenase-4 component J
VQSQVAFYRLRSKVVNDQKAIPEDARQVMYYSLAIGHHIGVMDCFSEMMVVPTDAYQECLNRLPESEGRRKLEGALQWEEIEINRSHVDALMPPLKRLQREAAGSDLNWVPTLVHCLEEIVAEPALYLMVKLRK